MTKKERNDENIEQVINVLTAANYQCGNSVKTRNERIEFWIGPGRINVIVLQYYPDDNGFEVYVPITQSNQMNETLEALQDATAPTKPQADAQLITAAAPELLKAAQTFVLYMEHAGEKTISIKSLAYPLHLAERAIAKATGAGDAEVKNQ